MNFNVDVIKSIKNVFCFSENFTLKKPLILENLIKSIGYRTGKILALFKIEIKIEKFVRG